jgi:hypothetical protein
VAVTLQQGWDLAIPMSPHRSAIFLQHSRSADVIVAPGNTHAATGSVASINARAVTPTLINSFNITSLSTADNKTQQARKGFTLPPSRGSANRSFTVQGRSRELQRPVLPLGLNDLTPELHLAQSPGNSLAHFGRPTTATLVTPLHERYSLRSGVATILRTTLSPGHPVGKDRKRWHFYLSELDHWLRSQVVFSGSYRTLLDETGAPMKVQQELMRHANIQTTMNVYGSAMLESKRTANSKVVRTVLVPPIKRENGKGRAPATP